MVINIRIDEEFKRKLEYLQRINGYKSKSDTIRKTVEKEYAKEKEWNWTPFRTWDDMPTLGGCVFVTIVNCFGQRFVTKAYIHCSESKIGWEVNDIVYAENWKEGDFRLSHNWKVIAWKPFEIPYKGE